MVVDKKFGKYLLTKNLGSGATSDVYLAHDTEIERDVAIKILKPTLVADQVSFTRFKSEAKAAGKLFQDNIATIFDMGEVDGRFYISMRYIEGMSLGQYLVKNGPLRWENVKKLAYQIGSALSYAHSQGYIHRDIKPNNIMVDLQGNFFLTDFGLTRAMLDSGMTSTTGAVLGTPPYIPPEIWNGKEAGPSSDQYSFACVLNEAITGNSLFSGTTPQEIITKHLVKKPELSAYPADIPGNVQYIIQKALSKESQDRFSDIQAFVTTLINPMIFNVEVYLKQINSREQSVSDINRLEKFKTLKRRRITSIIIVFGLTIIAIIFAIGINENWFSRVTSILGGPNIVQTQEFLQSTINSLAMTSTENYAQELTQTEMSRLIPTETSTSLPTFTPKPSSTPTIEITPSEIPTIDTRPSDTSSGTILSVGETWTTQGFSVLLRDVSFQFGDEVDLEFTITNNSGKTLFFHINADTNIILNDNNGKVYTWATPYNYDMVMENGDSKNLQIFKGGNFSGIQSLFVTVDLPNLILGKWQIN